MAHPPKKRTSDPSLEPDAPFGRTTVGQPRPDPSKDRRRTRQAEDPIDQRKARAARAKRYMNGGAWGNYYPQTIEEVRAGKRPKMRFVQSEFPSSWPKWGLRCEWVSKRGKQCGKGAIPGSRYCRTHGAVRSPVALRMRRYFLFCLTGKHFLDGQHAALDLVVDNEIEKALVGNRKISDETAVRLAIVLMETGFLELDPVEGIPFDVEERITNEFRRA